MKHLYIAMKKLKSFLKERPFLFVLFFAGSVSCSLMFVYFWGNMMYLVQTYRAPSYTATLEQEMITDVEALCALADSYDTRVDAICPLNRRMLGGRTAEAFFAASDGEPVPVLCTNRIGKFYFWGCGGEELQKEGSVILSVGLLEGTREDDAQQEPELVLLGKPLNVAGRTSGGYSLLSPETFASFGLPATELRLTLGSSLSKGERADFLRAFDELTNGTYALQETTAELPLGELLVVALPMLFVYLLSMFAMLYILIYLLEGMTYELSVYGLLGARTRSLILIPALLQGTLLLGAELLAVLLHSLLYRALFARINLEPFAYSAGMYVQAVGVMLALSFAVMLLYLKRRIGGSTVVNLRKNIV